MPAEAAFQHFTASACIESVKEITCKVKKISRFKSLICKGKARWWSGFCNCCWAPLC